jgi:hypothetical protein
MMMVFLVPLAAAQSWPGGSAYDPEQLNADPFRPAMDPGALLATESAGIPEQLIARADLTEVHNPLIWISEEDEQVNLIGDALGLHLSAARGLGRVRLGVSAPLIRLMASDAHEVPAVMAGDLALSGKVALKQGDGVRLAALTQLTVPSNADEYQLGHDTATAELVFIADGGQRLSWLVNAGYRLQPTTQLVVESGELLLDDALLLRGGIAAPVGEQTSLTGELLASLTPSALAVESTPVEVLLGARRHTREGRLLRGGLGIGVIGGIGAPTWRLMIGVGHDPGPPLVLVPDDMLPDTTDPDSAAAAEPASVP